MTNTQEIPLLIQVIKGRCVKPLPVWLMRQAGRYLSEYRALRECTGSFWQMCMTPAMAKEITLQPIERFDFDAAIVFSDILVVPHALGQIVRFEEGVGPQLGALENLNVLDCEPAHWKERFSPVYETIHSVRKSLSPAKALIGFAGGAWTLAAYMLEGGGSKDQQAAKSMAAREPEQFNRLVGTLCDIIAWHLAEQLKAGADVVQIFDSHAGSLSGRDFARWVIEPTKRIVDKLHSIRPGALVIGFPRGAAKGDYERYTAETGINAVSLDTNVDLAWAAPALGRKVTLQGNLDPLALVAGGSELDQAIDNILEAVRETPFIFNLGHGVLPQTPVANVEHLIARVRAST